MSLNRDLTVSEELPLSTMPTRAIKIHLIAKHIQLRMQFHIEKDIIIQRKRPKICVDCMHQHSNICKISLLNS